MEDVQSSSDPSGSPTNGSEQTVKCSEDPVLCTLTEKLGALEKMDGSRKVDSSKSLDLDSFFSVSIKEHFNQSIKLEIVSFKYLVSRAGSGINLDGGAHCLVMTSANNSLFSA